MERFDEFCSTTTLAGWNHLPGSSKAAKFYWTLVILGSICVGAAFVYITLDEFLNTFVEMSVETSTGSLNRTTFPQVLVCNVYNVRKSFWNAIFNSSSPPNDMKDAFMKEFVTGYKEDDVVNQPDEENLTMIDRLYIELINKESYNLTIVKELAKVQDYSTAPSKRTKLLVAMGQNLHSMVLEYNIQNDKFYSIAEYPGSTFEFSIDGYICYRIKPAIVVKSGVSNGVSILLDAETFDNGNEKFPFKGFNAMLVDAVEGNAAMMVNLQAFLISAGTNSKISIKPELFEITEDAKDRFSSSQRNCIYNNDHKSWPHNNEFELDGNNAINTLLGRPPSKHISVELKSSENPS